MTLSWNKTEIRKQLVLQKRVIIENEEYFLTLRQCWISYWIKHLELSRITENSFHLHLV